MASLTDTKLRKSRSARSSRKGKNKKQQNLTRQRLPGIESYEKELEFTAEGPGRVVVRLERLMGSDRIRITDPKYLQTLVERLEHEESHSWVVRSRLRKKGEKNRSRQLAIDGLMEPAADMIDLYEHPVFRVNRVLNRLSVFDSTMATPGAHLKPPPIQPIEPFIEDDTGRIFKTYSGHTFVWSRDSSVGEYDLEDDEEETPKKSKAEPALATLKMGMKAKKEKKKKDKSVSGKKSKPVMTETRMSTKESRLSTKESRLSTKESRMSRKESKTKVKRKFTEPGRDNDEEGGEEGEGEMEEGEMWEEADEEDEGEDGEGASVGGSSMGSKSDKSDKIDLEELPNELTELQKLYGVPSDEDLVKHWGPYRSDLAEMIYSEMQAAASLQLYTMGEEITGVYARQFEAVRDYVVPREREIEECIKLGDCSKFLPFKDGEPLSISTIWDNEEEGDFVLDEEEGDGAFIQPVPHELEIEEMEEKEGEYGEEEGAEEGQGEDEAEAENMDEEGEGEQNDTEEGVDEMNE